MSAIIEKAFDASKKIIRSIFKGSPNLITSSDLNRQIEAIKYQLDQLDDKTGVISDIEISQNLSGGTLNVSYSFTYMRFKGCSFSPAVTALNTNLTNSAPTAYLCLVADSETVTYESDSSHDIAGAKFEDGTSLPAANQMVYKNESLMLTHALSSVNNLVGVIAIFQLSDSGNVVVKTNTLQDKTSLSLSKGGTIVDFNSSLKGKIANGKTYDEAFSILENRASNLVTGWTDLVVDSSFLMMGSSKAQFVIRNGVLLLNLTNLAVKIGTHSSYGSNILTVASFPTSIQESLKTLFNSFNLRTNQDFHTLNSSGGKWIPYGDFGTFVAIDPTENDTAYTTAKLSLILHYSENNSLDSIDLGLFADHILRFKTDGSVGVLQKTLQNWNSFEETCEVYIPRMFTGVPLPGAF